ncbi:hypothetical protein Terro_1937 [Terriglobus roseus DSM 18391]|uniref:Abnormal spindle-like microcephaly-assoc'd, ASPM-SPD-2-Hydin n=1 Tax=Terriglobus roseus (strain DSM 18391 / NRRL B-41598 / KBS 63) TaxID=926566 RepID=I3ZG56_TERRK|nr:choice-of-anchor D domain-containing protein [Terriglobus roseus]AFL88224.1 hypothetical protein Terro_1937 [Terriglobus roseus DSM 18391]
MRKLWLLLLLALGIPAYAADPACTGLCLKQVTCTGGATTSITGTVFAPNGVDPLPNVLVFIPNAPIEAFTPGVACPAPNAPPTGSPLVGGRTAADGSFRLVNVPVGTAIPLVIQSGRWRRQLTVSTTTACADTAFSARMPRNQTEGDIPLIAVATGRADAVECVLRKVGIDEAEVTNPMGTGRIHLYTGSGSKGAEIDITTPSQSSLMDDAAQLSKYDVLMLPCQGTSEGQTTPDRLTNLLGYANAGGRVYASHYSYAWFHQNGPFASVAAWPANEVSARAGGTATVNTSFASGKTLSDWLQVVGASTSPGQVNLQEISPAITGVNAPTQVWLTLNSPSQGNPVQQFTFNTPVGSANQCGRVLFNEYHVESPAVSPAKAFPTECSKGAMTSQEKLLEYSLFDLTNSGAGPTLTPASAEFGMQAVGFSTAAKIFTLTNDSIFPSVVSSVTVTSDFLVTSNSCGNLAPNASCQIGVVFKPTAIGAATGTLTVFSNASTATSTLTGTGVDFTIAMTPASGSLIAGTSLTAPVTVLPLAGYAGAVTISCTTTVPGSTCTPNKTSVIPSAVAGVSVTITSTSKYAVVGYGGFGRGVMALVALCSVCLLWRRRSQVRSLVLTSCGVLMLLAVCGAVTGCSSKLPGQNAVYTAPGTYTYTITATDGLLKHSATYSLKVTVN